MAKPAANTESGNAKVMPLADLTATTPVATNPAAPVKSVSGDAGYGPVGWLGIATHGDGDIFTAPGAGVSATTDSAGVSKGPTVALGGKDLAGTPMLRAVRVDENGILIVSNRQAVNNELLTPGGAVTIAGTVETAITTAGGAGIYGYLTSIEAVCTVASTAAGTFTLRKANAGTTILVLQQPKAASVVGDRYIWTFPTPRRTNATNGVFTIQHSANQGTWVWIVNGFLSSQ